MHKFGISTYRGAFSKDMLPKDLGTRTKVLVVNIQDYFAGPGTHWVAIYNNEYFDSFGLPPPLEIAKFMGPNLLYNSSQIQDMDSILCGYYSCYYIIGRYQGRKPIDILLDFNMKPTLYNEAWIRQFAHIVSKRGKKQPVYQVQNDTKLQKMGDI